MYRTVKLTRLVARDRVQIVDKGSGTPLVLIPPLQGRWEYMSDTVDALARSFRVRRSTIEFLQGVAERRAGKNGNYFAVIKK